MFDDKSSAERLIGALVDDLLKASREDLKDGSCDYSEQSISKLERLKVLIPIWGIEDASLDSGEINRKSNMFGGNPFTSLKHPWPLNDRESPSYPLVQVDLRQISELSGREFGSGLLQVWLDITDSALPSTIRVIDLADMGELLQDDYPDQEQIEKIDVYRSWFGIAQHFTFNFLGFMMPRWESYEIELDCYRDLRAKEVEIIEQLEKISEENGFQSLNGDWFLGYPDRGSGAPAGRYDSEPTNLIQFSTADTFPMVSVSRYANLFYSNDDGEFTYFFDWNG
jgi:hypothetical protein